MLLGLRIFLVPSVCRTVLAPCSYTLKGYTLRWVMIPSSDPRADTTVPFLSTMYCGLTTARKLIWKVSPSLRTLRPEFGFAAISSAATDSGITRNLGAGEPESVNTRVFGLPSIVILSKTPGRSPYCMIASSVFMKRSASLSPILAARASLTACHAAILFAMIDFATSGILRVTPSPGIRM